MASNQLTVIYGERASALKSAEIRGEQLWIDTDEISAISGWVKKPEGFCKGNICVPVPTGRETQFLAGRRANLAALAELLGQPIVKDDEHRVWSIGESATERKRALTSLEAPDFELPDVNGRMHRRSEYRGKKVLLASWASW
jgi:hypothetical protein